MPASLATASQIFSQLTADRYASSPGKSCAVDFAASHALPPLTVCDNQRLTKKYFIACCEAGKHTKIIGCAGGRAGMPVAISPVIHGGKKTCDRRLWAIQK